ncbi:MAG: DUF748 domain-containing protein [Caulobacteraceae bacterium]|nr:DUF748 domain-containing protein [Caulobacteraceae bacterium]
MSEAGVGGDPSTGPETRAPSRLRGWLIGIGAVVLVLGGLIAFGFWGAPGVIRAQALKALETTYHRKARLDQVRLNPLKLRLEADGFSLPDRDGRPMIGFERLVVSVSPTSIWRGRLALSEVAIDHPMVRAVRRADGRINLADLVPPARPRPPGAAADKPFKLSIAHFHLGGGEAILADQQRPDPIERRLSRIAFSLNDFSTVADPTARDGAGFSLTARSDRGEGIEWRGDLGIAPVASNGRFRFSGWQAAPLAALAGADLPVRVMAGRIDVSGAYRFALAGRKPALTVDIDQAALRDAAFRAPGADADWVKLAALEVSDAHLDLARTDVRLGHVVATGPDLTAWLDRSGINLARFAPRSAKAPEDAGASATKPSPWTLEAPDIRVAQGRVAFEDRTARETVALGAKPIDIAVEGFAYPLAAPLKISASATLDDGSTVTAAGAVTLPTGAGGSPTGEFDIMADSVDLTRFQPYVRRAANLRIATGELSAKGHLSLRDKGVVAYRGGARIDDLEAIDPVLKSDLVTWDRLALNDIAVVSNPLDVKVRQVVATTAYARVVLEQNYDVNIRTVLETPGAEGSTPVAAPAVGAGQARLDFKPVSKPTPRPRSAAGSKPAPVQIGQVLIQNGRMDFTDLTVAPHFSAGILALNGTITGLSGRPGSKAVVDLKGAVDRYAPVTISGALNPFDAMRFTDIRMNFQNMELTSFSPYSGKFAGYRIDKGKLNVDLHYLINDLKLDATHHVVIDQLQLGDKVDSADAVKLPVKLIVALLKDRNGVIDLPIDISGSLDDPKFKVWPVIWKVVGNLFEKIATAPFSLLGKLVGGGDGEAMSHIRFEPGVAPPPQAERAKLVSLAKALTERPALNLEIPMTEAPDLDGPVLSEARYRQVLAGALKVAFKGDKTPALETVLAAPKLKRRLLEALYRQSLGQKPVPPKSEAPTPGRKLDPDQAANDWMEAALRPRFAVGETEIKRLAQARAEAVEAVLIDEGKIDPKRLFVVTAAPLAQGPIDMTLALR